MALQKAVHRERIMEMLMDRHIHDFVIISLVCILRCSVLVDSHACDEIPWQEPGEKQRPSLLSTTKKKSRAGNDNRKRVKDRTGVSRVFLTLDDARIS